MWKMFVVCVVFLVLFTAIAVLNTVQGNWMVAGIWWVCVVIMAQTCAILKLLTR